MAVEYEWVWMNQAGSVVLASGTYEDAVKEKESLALYGISNENGIIFAFVAHFVNTLLIIVLGLISMLLLPLVNRKK